ncbi:MAG: hypothetical protein ACI915_001677 [Gammaproteobacteria bacterium]
MIPDSQWAEFPKVQEWFDRLAARPHAQTVSITIKEAGRMRQAGKIIPMTRRTSLAKGTEIVGSGNLGLPYLND